MVRCEVGCKGRCIPYFIHPSPSVYGLLSRPVSRWTGAGRSVVQRSDRLRYKIDSLSFEEEEPQNLVAGNSCDPKREGRARQLDMLTAIMKAVTLMESERARWRSNQFE